jgi:uncharacterized membrane protein YqiK
MPFFFLVIVVIVIVVVVVVVVIVVGVARGWTLRSQPGRHLEVSTSADGSHNGYGGQLKGISSAVQ